MLYESAAVISINASLGDPFVCLHSDCPFHRVNNEDRGAKLFRTSCTILEEPLEVREVPAVCEQPKKLGPFTEQ